MDVLQEILSGKRVNYTMRNWEVNCKIGRKTIPTWYVAKIVSQYKDKIERKGDVFKGYVKVRNEAI